MHVGVGARAGTAREVETGIGIDRRVEMKLRKENGVGHFAQTAARFETIHPGHDDVQQDGVGMGFISQLKTHLARGGRGYFKAILAKPHAKDFESLVLIIDDQDSGPTMHS